MNRGDDFPIQRMVGVLLTVGGLWHAAAPWIFGYSHIQAAAVSNVAAGLTVAAVGLGYIILRGGWLLDVVGAATGIWILISPQVLGTGGPGGPGLEASWGGPLTLAVVVIAALDRMWGHAPSPASERFG